MDKHDEQFESYLRKFRLRQPGPLPEMASLQRRSSVVWVLAAAAVVLVAGLSVLFVRNTGSGSGPKAIVEAAGNPSLYQIGETIEAGKVIRSNSAVGLLLAIEDGSRIEMHTQSELKLESVADGIRVRLNGGSIVVTAAKQGAGHLYVQTRDAMVSVVGTVFLVSAEQSGTTVAVVEGEVQVQQGSELKKLLPGEQVATNPTRQSESIAEQISWSRNATEYVAMLQQPAGPAQEQRIAVVNPQPVEAIGENSLALFRMAEARFEYGDINTAVQLFRDALNGDLNPKWLEVWAHINIGKIYDVRGGQRDRAVQEYQKAVNTGDDTYSAQAEAKKYLAAPFSLSGPTQQAVALPYPSLAPPALVAQQQARTSPAPQSDSLQNISGKQIFDRSCTSCHNAEVALRMESRGIPLSNLERKMLSMKRSELAQLRSKGLTNNHPDVITVMGLFAGLEAREIDVTDNYKLYVFRHLGGFGKTPSNEEVSTLASYLYEETSRKLESQDRPAMPPQPVQPNDKDGQKEDPDIAGARILNSACTTCHDLGPVTGRTEDRAAWQGIVEGMVGYGANVKDAEISVLVDYLFKYYGKRKKEPKPADPIPPEIPVRRP